MSKKNICLYTSNYPYGTGEQFLETEINYLAKEFNNIYIFPYKGKKKIRNIPHNAKVVLLSHDGYTTAKGTKTISRWFLRALIDILKKKNRIHLISCLLRFGFQAKKLSKLIIEYKLITNTIHYSYWLDDWSTILSILTERKVINNYISRAHGYDLYHERRKEGYIPFRKFQLQNLNKLFLISKDGFNYICDHYPEFYDKYKLSLLGTKKYEPTNNLKYNPNTYTIISCSRVVAIKRLELIIKSLAIIKEMRITWIHFGDGNLLSEIKKLSAKILPENIKAEFKGMITNTDVLRFYENNYIDCFINLSSTEGLPVSIMEAISYGIPTLATDVGGTNEIVNNKTGFLIKPDIKPEIIANKIIDILQKKSRNIDYRNEIIEFWKNNFCADTNYREFVQELKYIN
ncbi:glycosyltransferase [Marinilabiliaceae bacterium JC017]|nr:glycosyltransferase [Marinilabiliaceae bacterium JC017]